MLIADFEEMCRDIGKQWCLGGLGSRGWDVGGVLSGLLPRIYEIITLKVLITTIVAENHHRSSG